MSGARSEKQSRDGAELRQILVAAVGEAPQIVTETVWWFGNRMKPPRVFDEIHLFATKRGERVAREALPGRRGALTTYSSAYEVEVPKLVLHTLRNRAGRALADIRTSRDNLAVGDQILRIVANLTADPATVCHFSIAGGRKTLAHHIAQAATFFAREFDTLSHILVPAGMEYHPDAFYPPPGDPARGFDLALLPFIRLRGETGSAKTVAGHITGFSRRFPRRRAPVRVGVSLRDGYLLVDGRKLSAPAQQIALWLIYAREPAGHTIGEILEHREAFFAYIRKAGADPEASALGRAWNSAANDASAASEVEQRLLQLRSKFDRIVRAEFGDGAAAGSVLLQPLRGRGRPARYGIPAPSPRIEFLE